MKLKTVLILALAALVACLAAAYVLTRYAGPDALRAGNPGPMLPDMAQRLGELAVINVESVGRRVSLRREEGLWAIEQRDGYHADPTKVRDLVLGLERLQKLEPRTQLAKNHARLHLRDLKHKDSKAHKITLIDMDGHIVAGLMVGKRNFNIGDGGQSGIYLRRAESNETWLARGELPFSDDPTQWMNRLLIDLPAEAVAKVTLFHPKDHVVVLSKDPLTKRFRPENAPTGSGAAKPMAVLPLTQALDGLLFEDVRRADRIPFDPDGSLLVEIQTTAGPMVRMTVAPFEEAHWARLSLGRAEETADPAQDGLRRALLEAVRRADGWVFKIPETTAAALNRKMVDLVQMPN
ncbi:DUF4340 domain-containing protein [Magnetospira sp. QH-2]|uniref:DUF4340 domain-containing protein n=1 Tax=Magnetospira sp. (strain QH-2) TaxID=1288970 RepID=UPI0003E81603|nr:DUF4340 domain-containing protein [Magnetospira sp. QH-2]CCQ75586.1 exported protein of unknown function [Magnetospira sp. QH-2]